MNSHLHVRLHDGFVTVSRLVARLHSLGVAVDELHVRGEHLCVHLTNANDARRVRAVLGRCPDASLDSGADPSDAACVHAGAHAEPPLRTTYMVWSEPLSVVRRPQRRSRIPA